MEPARAGGVNFGQRDHRDGVAADYGPGIGWPEDRNTTHWLENRGTITAVEVSVDIISTERSEGDTISRSCGSVLQRIDGKTLGEELRRP